MIVDVKVKMIGDKILVKPDATEGKTSGGILLPGTAQVESLRGKVLKVGEEVTEGIEAGDVVLYQDRTIPIKIENEEYVIVREFHVHAVLKSK